MKVPNGNPATEAIERSIREALSAAGAAHVRVTTQLAPAWTTDWITPAARDKLRDNAVVDGGDAALYGLGAMTEDRWRAFFEATSQTGVYDPGLNWREAFTNAYLPGRG